MTDYTANANSKGERKKVRWDDLYLTLSFTMKNNGGRYLSLFVPDHFMYCYVNLYAYLQGDMSIEQLVCCLPLITQPKNGTMN